MKRGKIPMMWMREARGDRLAAHVVIVLTVGVLLTATVGQAQQGAVAETLHNLSISGPGEIRSSTETEICKFCHIPHNPVEPEPLWGHKLSAVSSYDTPEMSAGHGTRALAPQPDGSSRLCLSCHDGTVALGDIAGEPQPIAMAGAQRLTRGRRGFIGTDLSGSHPISFVVPDQAPDEAGWDMGIRPLSAIQTDRDIKLDARGKMQCTTCHDPHSDANYRPGQVPHFWVKPTVDGVCLTCHELR